MSLETLISKYIASAEHAFGQMNISATLLSLDRNDVEKVIEHAKAYLEDAKYYKRKERLSVSLASIAYCEGLLDALKLLQAVRFEWPKGEQEEKQF
jgi:FAD synthetase